MIDEITYIESRQTEPYENLAVEEYLLNHCKENQCILYLWQNKRTIVIGRNQNAWKECLVEKLENEGGHLVRRLSGGGAVYHDTENLNFTFLVRKENYDLDRQLEVILRAVKKLGVHAEKSGRNDILAEGKKFSGNAFYEQAGHCYHHGTLMVNVDIGDLSKYLTVSKEKLQSKGVDSVKSRVTNLKEFALDITVDALKEKLVEAFEEVYGLKTKQIETEDLAHEEIEESRKRFASWDWILGKKIDFQHELSNRFSWGQFTMQVKVNCGKIEDVVIFSDSMETNMMPELPGCLKGITYNKKTICSALENFKAEDAKEKEMLQEITAWLGTVDL